MVRKRKRKELADEKGNIYTLQEMAKEKEEEKMRYGEKEAAEKGERII